MSCGVGCRLGSDPALLWLWRGLVAAALIRLLAWEPPYAARAALEKAKRQKKGKKRKYTKQFKGKKPSAMLTRLSEWKGYGKAASLSKESKVYKTKEQNN